MKRKILWLNLQRTLDNTTSDGSCDDTTAKKGHHFVAMTRIGRQFFLGESRVTPLVAAPGDTNPRDDAAGCSSSSSSSSIGQLMKRCTL